MGKYQELVEESLNQIKQEKRMGKYQELVEESLNEETLCSEAITQIVETVLLEKKTSLAEKIVALIYGEAGSYMYRPGFVAKVLGSVGKYIPREHWEKNRIRVSTKHGDDLVREMVPKYLYHSADPQLSINARNLKEVVDKTRQTVRTEITKCVRKEVASGGLHDETKTYEDNYSGWIFSHGDDDAVARLMKKARPNIIKALTKLIEKERYG